MAELPWHPFLGVAGALLLGAPFWAWMQVAGGWGPAVLFAASAVAAGLWVRTLEAPRTLAAFIVAAAVVLAMLLPIGWIAVAPPDA